MVMIILVNDTDAEHLEAVKAEMEKLGSPSIRAIDAGDYLIAVEGSHRLRAAEELGIAVNINVIDEDDEIHLGSLDWDDYGWFDERIVSGREFIEGFTRPPFPAGQPTADIKVA